MRTRRAVLLLGATSATVFVAGGLLVVVTYESLREGPLPVVLAVDIVVLAAVLWTTRRLGLGTPAVLSRLGSALALAGLAVVLGFLGSILLFEGLTDRLPEWVATVGTFLGSAASLLALPVGLLMVAVAILREGRLPGWARPLPLLATFLLMAAPVAVAVAPEGKSEGQVAAILFAGAGVIWSSYVFGMAGASGPDPESSTRFEPGEPPGTPTPGPVST